MTKTPSTAAAALQRYLASDAPADRVTVSSDAGGCLPCFDGEGRVCSMDVGSSGALLETLQALVAGGTPLAAALPAFTSNPARLLRLAGKGRVEAGADADLVALDATGAAADRHYLGQIHVRGGEAVRRGTFETALGAAQLPSIVPEGGTRGWIIPIGGAENKENDRHILERFVQVSGGERRRHRRDPDREPAHRYRPALREAVPRHRRGPRHRDRLRHAARLPGIRTAAAAGAGDRHLLHRRQPAAHLDAARRHAASPR